MKKAKSGGVIIGLIVSIVLAIITVIGSIHLTKGETEKTVTFSFDAHQKEQAVKINADKGSLYYKLRNDEDISIYYIVRHKSAENGEYIDLFGSTLDGHCQSNWAYGDSISSVFNKTRWYSVTQDNNLGEEVTSATLFLRVE